jgi:3-hydroxyacyl-[acyl-carrier-protein] dehydratase
VESLETPKKRETRSHYEGKSMNAAQDQLKIPMDIETIQKCIPHRYPFLLIDRVVEAVPFQKIVATKNISYSDPFLQGHFPGNPIFPGVLVIEAIAQAAGVLGHLSYENGLSACYLTEVTHARFRRKIVPGDVLRLDVSVLKKRPPFFWFDAECSVDGEQAADVKLSAFIK